MRRVGTRCLIILVVFLSWAFLAGDGALRAQGPGGPQDYKEAIRSARRTEMLGYILAGAGILLVVAAIPIGIYLDRKKKARKRAAQGEPDGDSASGPPGPPT